jgi:exopolysaccharide biosynthesis polyprenyl glycosylphosphotransferase
MIEALFLGAVDFALVWLSAIATLSIRLDSGAISYGTMLAKNTGSLILLSILIVLFCHAQRLYDFSPRTKSSETLAVLRAVGLATVVLSASLYLLGQSVVSRIALGITVIASASLLLAWREVRRRRIAKRAAAGQDCRNILVFGWSPAAEVVGRHLIENQVPGYVIKGFIDHPSSVQGKPGISDIKRLGHVDDLSDIVRAHFIDEILVFQPEDRELVKQLIAESRNSGVALRVVPDSYDGLAWGAAIEHLGPFPAIRLHEKPMPILGLILKRCVDIVGSILALLFCFPLCLLIALLIRLDSPGPVFYLSERVGRKGTIFKCYKFRTMIRNAEALKDGLLERNERGGILFKIRQDPRITRVGRFLRKYSLDEIPQFLNVLNGDMSLVGPRPPIPGEYQQYELAHLKRLLVSPGITGLWQVESRRNPSFESYINLDTQYVDHWSIWLDIRILFKTVGVVFAGTGQ